MCGLYLGYFEKRKKTDIQYFKYQPLSEPLARLELATYALRKIKGALYFAL